MSTVGRDHADRQIEERLTLVEVVLRGVCREEGLSLSSIMVALFRLDISCISSMLRAPLELRLYCCCSGGVLPWAGLASGASGWNRPFMSLQIRTSSSELDTASFLRIVTPVSTLTAWSGGTSCPKCPKNCSV